jgi:hypothetical protein
MGDETGGSLVAKKPKLDVGAIVRGAARKHIGQPPATKTVPHKRKQKLDEIREREAREDS